MEQVNNLIEIGILKPFAAVVQAPGEMDGGILHPFMRILRAADQKEILAAGDAVIIILIIKTDPQKSDQAALSFCFLLGFLFGHVASLPGKQSACGLCLLLGKQMNRRRRLPQTINSKQLTTRQRACQLLIREKTAEYWK
jgi:hypothetical protein